MAIKPARLLILGIAFAAAAGAYVLSRPSQVEVAAAVVPAPSQPVVPMDKVLVAKTDLPMGMQLGPADMDWQEWPVSGISPNMIRQSGGRAEGGDCGLHCAFGLSVGRTHAPRQAGQRQ